MITASNSQTSVSDNNLVEISFKNGGVEPVETEPGCSRSRTPHLRILPHHEQTESVNEPWDGVMDLFGLPYL